MKITKNNNHTGSNSLNKHLFTKSSQISSNATTTQRLNESNKSKNSNKNVLEMIYDDEFVIMINQLSTSIKNYYRANNKNFNTIKSIFNTSEMKENSDNELLIEAFNRIENSFSLFYSSAKQIFKNMKIYRREKIANILSQNKKKPVNNRNNNNPLNFNIKQRNSEAKIKQLLKSPNDSSSKNIFEDDNKNQVFSLNMMSSDKIRHFNEKNDSEFLVDNNMNEYNTNKNNNNEYFEVINTYTKKNALKSTSNIKEFKFNEENNASLISSVKGENNKTKRIYINSLNKSDKKPKNKKLSVFGINTTNIKKRVKSSDKKFKQNFEIKKRKDSGQINKNVFTQENFETFEDINEIIKEKEESIINLKTNNVHLENKVKELEEANNILNQKIKEVEKDIKEKEDKFMEINTEKENLVKDNDILGKKIMEINEENNKLGKQYEENILNINELNSKIENLKKNLNEINIEKNIINDKYNLLNEDNFNLKKETNKMVQEKTSFEKEKINLENKIKNLEEKLKNDKNIEENNNREIKDKILQIKKIEK